MHMNDQDHDIAKTIKQMAEDLNKAIRIASDAGLSVRLELFAGQEVTHRGFQPINAPPSIILEIARPL